jgi:hypothetical protein
MRCMELSQTEHVLQPTSSLSPSAFSLPLSLPPPYLVVYLRCLTPPPPLSLSLSLPPWLSTSCVPCCLCRCRHWMPGWPKEPSPCWRFRTSGGPSPVPHGKRENVKSLSSWSKGIRICFRPLAATLLGNDLNSRKPGISYADAVTDVTLSDCMWRQRQKYCT